VAEEFLMNTFISIIIDGISYSMILFMISVGLSMTMGLMRFVNLAHGSFAMAGGFMSASLPRLLRVPFELGVVTALVSTVSLAFAIEIVVLRRFYARSHMDQMLLTIGIMFVAIATANAIFGSAITTIEFPNYLSGSIDLGFRTMPRNRLYVIALGVLVITLLWFAIEKSPFGIWVRAAVDSPATAQAVGINTNLVYGIVFAAGAALAGLGGVAGAEVMPMEPSYASKYLVPALAVVAVGGYGTLTGSFLAALLLGVAETSAKYLAPDLSSIVFYVTMFVILTVRPQGLQGRE
jgi:branched-chain amino acid transport system permease protein